jgi:hypothetical protein
MKRILILGAMLFAISYASIGAQAAPAVPTPPPPPAAHTHTPVWPWVVIGCAGSVVLSAVVADFWSHRELTTPEAWTCGLLYWVPMPYPPQPTARSH